MVRPSLLAFGLVVIAAACNATTAAAPSDADAGIGGGSLDKATCPAEEPGAGSTCGVPQGTTCQFGSCGTRIARCDRGVWVFAQTPPPRPACPSAPPAEDDPCPSCWPGGTCTYAPETCAASPPDGGDAGAVPNIAVATCAAGRWMLAFQPCIDSGADVQGDAGADAD